MHILHCLLLFLPFNKIPLPSQSPPPTIPLPHPCLFVFFGHPLIFPGTSSVAWGLSCPLEPGVLSMVFKDK